MDRLAGSAGATLRLGLVPDITDHVWPTIRV